METSSFIGSSIFLYIVAFIVVMAIFAYLTYRTSPKRKQRREDSRNQDHLK
ncbi:MULTISPECIES: hypothetical protein [Psychrobacter]|uniref:hypothetical protein n=1 Tax=Psychrobacter TaxID=497 RepID=UPI00097F5E3B|nr:MULTISPECIES: hypothetical protein [Psychrobacter]SJN38131.1 hypothetical protein CZ794_10160 [Psychrobacter sp. JB385]